MAPLIQIELSMIIYFAATANFHIMKVLADRRNLFQRQIGQLEVLPDGILPAASLSAMMSKNEYASVGLSKTSHGIALTFNITLIEGSAQPCQLLARE